MLKRSSFHTNSRTDICATHQLRHRWRFAWNDARHRSSVASVHRRHELARLAAAFLSMFLQSIGFRSVLLGGKRCDKWTQVSRFRRLIVSHARWAGTLPCWKIKNSLQISRMTGSDFESETPYVIDRFQHRQKSGLFRAHHSPQLGHTMDTISDLCVCSRLSGATCLFLVAASA